MGGGASVDVDASALRREYETLAATNVSDEELLKHMKKLIISPLSENVSTANEVARDVNGTRRTSVRRGSGGSRSNKAEGPKNARTSQTQGSAILPGEGATECSTKRGSAARPSSQNNRLSYSASTQASLQQRRGRASVHDSRPVSAPQTKPPVPKQRPRSSVRDEATEGSAKPTKSRRRSFVAQPATEQAGDDAAVAGVVAESEEPTVVAPDGDGTTPDDENLYIEKMQIDSWESVSKQPSCPLCNMVFTTEGKRDQHIKYSPAHAPPEEGAENAPEPIMESTTIYSGTKLFWQTRLNVEVFMQQHKKAGTVQVLLFDVGTRRELGQLWVPWGSVVEKLDPKEMKKQMEAAEMSFHNLGMKPIADSVAAEATRKAVASYIIKRIQVDENIVEDAEPGVSTSYNISLIHMAADDEMNLLMDKPEGINATFDQTLIKRASMKEVNEVMTVLKKGLGDVNNAAQQAVASLETIEGTVEQGRRGSLEVARRCSIQNS